MRSELIGEPIQVLAAFQGGQARPLRFRWSGRTYRVEAVNASWLDRHPDGLCLHYSVQVGEETYFVHFDGKETQWWLDRIVLA